MPYSVPQVLVFQEFNLVPAEITDPLRALIAGPHAYLVRYAEPAEKAIGALGTYNPNAAVNYPWPSRPAGAIVDATYTKVFIDDAILQYYSDLRGVGSGVAPRTTGGVKNQITSADSSGSFKANGVSNARYAGLYDRDVAPGDLVTLTGVGSDTVTYTLNSYVQGVLSTGADRVAASVGSVSADAANHGANGASTTVTLVAGTSPNNALTASAASFSGLQDGYDDDTYTVTVTGVSTGGDFTTGRLSVVSASGLDNVASITPAATGTFFNVGAKGLQLKLTHTSGTDDLVLGQTWTVVAHAPHVLPVLAVSGTYTGTVNATYVVTCVRGGKFAASSVNDRPAYVVTTTTGVDASNTTIVGGTLTGLPLGTKGLTLGISGSSLLGLRLGEKWYVTATAAADGAFRTIVLGHNMPAGMLTATDLDLTLSLERDIQVTAGRLGYDPVLNWATSPTQLTVYDGILGYDPTYTNGGVPVPLPVVGGSVFVEYRAWQPVLTTAVGSITDVGTIDTVIAGPLHPDNPLKWGVYKALANSNGTAVKFIGVTDPASLDAWTHAISYLAGRDDVYNCVPLSFDPAVQALFATHINDTSNPTTGRWRGGFFCTPTVPVKAVVSAATSTNHATVLATIADDPATAGTQYTRVEVTSGNGNCITAGVRPGDVLRVNYLVSFGVPSWTEYVIDHVVTEDSLILVAGPASAITVGGKIEIWRNATKDEQAAAIAAVNGSFGSRRIKSVWPDQIGSAGTVMPGYYLAAALAGLRSGVLPHQGLTNVEIAGFDDVSRTTAYFTADQLNTLAGGGTWIVTQQSDGSIVTRQAVTTDSTDINTREEMVVANVDSMSYTFLRRLRPFIGRTNVTPSAVARLGAEVDSTISVLKNSGFTEALGSQLIDGKITLLQRSPLLKDRIVIAVALTIPYPDNTIELHLVV